MFSITSSWARGRPAASWRTASPRAAGQKVLLLEAGGSDRRFWIQVPIGYGRTFNDPRVNWMYEAEPDPALAARRLFWPRGKVLGGSGSINALVYYRGLPNDFDDWRALGNPGWGFSDVLPYFQRFEERAATAGRGATAAAAHQRCLSGRPSTVPELSRQLPCARLCAGTSMAPQGEGVGIYQIMTESGRRESTARRYLHPALQPRKSHVAAARAGAAHSLREAPRGGRDYRHAERTLAARRGRP
jgi:choline dehydrogenase